MQARRRAQPSGTNSPSSSHPRLKHRARCAIFFRARHAAARVAPDRGSWQARIHEPRGSAPRERDHRGGDHPVPSRTRQLSPPSPRVLQRKAAGGQGVALAEGAFLSAPRRKRSSCAPGEARGGTSPCGPLRVSGTGPRGAAIDAAGRRLGRRLRRRATGETRPARGFVSRVLFGIEACFRSACYHGAFSSAVLVRIVSRFRCSFPFLGLLAIVLVGLMRHTNCLAT